MVAGEAFHWMRSRLLGDVGVVRFSCSVDIGIVSDAADT